MKKITLSLVILLVAFSGCSGLTGQLQFMDQLKDSISEKYQTEKVDIDIRNNDKLIVSLKTPNLTTIAPAGKNRFPGRSER